MSISDWSSDVCSADLLSDGDGIGGATLATWRSQELACERLRVEGQARTPGVCAGRLIEASEYLRGNDPSQYYVIEVKHEGAQTLATATDTDAPAYMARSVALTRWLGDRERLAAGRSVP